jgi:CRP-like cAMP-binding protein
MRLKSSFLEGLAPREVDEVVAAAASKRFLANSVVMSQGQPANRMFLLTEGRVRYFFLTEGGRKLLLHWIVPGEIFGVSALFAKRASYVLGAEMVEDGTVLVWERGPIRRSVTKYPRLLDNTLPIFADYVTRHVAMQVAMTHQSARQRLAHVLVTLARAIGHVTQGGHELKVTNEELAAASNVTVFTASRLLSEWQRKGVLVKSRCKILLQFPEQLFPLEV